MYSRHVDLHEGVLVAEHELRQLLGEQRLADAGRAGEDEAADRPLRVLQAGPALADRLGDGLDRLVLADDRACAARPPSSAAARVSSVAEPRQRHAGHLADDLGDHLLVDDAVDLLGLLAPLAW